MSRGHGRLLGRSSSLPFHNMEWIMVGVGGFWKAKPYKERADFMRVKLCSFMYLYVITEF